MSTIRVGVDIDGVLARFNESYATLATSLTGFTFPPIDDIHYPNTWHWDKAQGMLSKDVSKVWQHIKISPRFWQDLKPYAEAPVFLNMLSSKRYLKEWEIYFITTRMGRLVKQQTEDWLEEYGFKNPTVIISRLKGQIAEGLELTHFIDDKPSNCHDVMSRSAETKVYLLDRPWNKAEEDVFRINSINEFLEQVSLDE